MTALLGVLATGVVPMALGGESATEAGGNGTAIAVVSVVSIVGAYLLLFVLWRYVFSARAKARRGEPPD
jgi:cation transporter-like permease